MIDPATVRQTAVKLLEKTCSELPVGTAELVNNIIIELSLAQQDPSKVYPILRDSVEKPDPPFSCRRGPKGGYFKKLGTADWNMKPGPCHAAPTVEAHMHPRRQWCGR